MSLLRDLLELTKPRITLFVVMVAFVGFAVGARSPFASLPLGLLARTLLGTALIASGTSSFNQLWEIEVDSRMKRTARRPLPSGRLSPTKAFVFATTLSVAGAWELAVFVNALTALLAVATLASYVLVYTPMKTRSPLSTFVGAIPGALPPLGGYTASHGTITAEGIALFAILFLWQLPHFLAIGWRFRTDYARAGCQTHATLDPSGRSSGRQALAYSLALFPASLLPSFLGTAGAVYALGTLLLTGIFLAAAVRFARQTTDAAARALFLASIAWLPAVLLLLLADRVLG